MTITVNAPSQARRSVLDELEAESIHIIREVLAEFENPGLLFPEVKTRW